MESKRLPLPRRNGGGGVGVTLSLPCRSGGGGEGVWS